MSTPIVTGLTANAPYKSDFVGTAKPPVTWRTETESADWTQASAELEFTSDGAVQTATVAGRDSVLVAWPFTALVAHQDGTLRARVTGTDGATSEWSEPLTVRAGFLGAGEWQAEMIGLGTPTLEAQPGLARSEFTVDGDVSKATAYATALGTYQLSINGTDSDDQILKPGWTAYQFRLIHETSDVTALLTQGANAVGVRFAGAWATELFGFRDHTHRIYAEQPAVAVQLVIEYVDGRIQEVLSDGSWRTHTGPITSSSIYQGEAYDARLVEAGWALAGFDDSSWAPARVDASPVVPEARTAPAVRPIEEIAVKDIVDAPSGAKILDFGQNLVGRLRITVSGPAGTVITLKHAEVLEHGELGTRPLRAAAATDHYTLAGTGVETWEPEFTFHGFRFAQLDGWPGEFDASAVTAVVIHSDMERTGWFDSSHQLVNQLHENVVWGLKGNFVYLPTDCPQRDERLGWTGDIQVFSPTASFLYDSRGFLSSWLRDLALEQEAVDGVVPFIVPNVLGQARPAAAWGDAATIVPTVLHERFGDIGVLETQFESMKDWADVLLAIAGDRYLWEGQFQFGDWLDPAAPPDDPAAALTDADIVASGHLYRSVDFVAKAAALLGKDDVAAEYRGLAEKVRAAYLAEYVTPSGRMMSDAQTGYAQTIMFDIAPEELIQTLGDRLAGLVRQSGYRIGTGFVGTPLVADALSRTGHSDVADRLLTQTENPSWLYPVTMGATTIWERWDSMLPDGSINPGEMTSFNHYAFGAIGDWLHRVLAGLSPAEPGYRKIRVAPQPIPSFDRAGVRHLTPYGLAAAGWEREADGSITVVATVPANTTAEIVLPDGTAPFEVGSGVHTWKVTVSEEATEESILSLTSSLSQIIDDPEAYRLLLDELTEVSPAVSEEVRSHTKWNGRDLQELLQMRTQPETQQRIAAGFDKINAERGLS